MFTTQGTMVFLNQGGCFFPNGLKEIYIPGIFQVEHRPKMELTGTDVGMVYTFELMFLQEPGKIFHVGGQIPWFYRRIFDYRYRLRITGHAG